MMCCKCRWWRPREELEHYCEIDEGECVRFPPFVPCVSKITDSGITVPELTLGSVLTTYPVTYAEEMCGEFVRKEEDSGGGEDKPAAETTNMSYAGHRSRCEMYYCEKCHAKVAKEKRRNLRFCPSCGKEVSWTIGGIEP